MMPSLAEIVFRCSLCDGPLIAWDTDAGRTTDCPHCLQPLTIPKSGVEIVNKDTFNEPLGLRRILQEVRDSEWESIRRKLQEARTRVATLESELEQGRAEVGPLREENASMLRLLGTARAELEAERRESVVAHEELARLKARGVGRRSMPLTSPVVKA